MQKAQRDHFRRIIQDMRTHAKAALGHGITARQVLEAQKGALPPNLRLALEAVVARDERGRRWGVWKRSTTNTGRISSSL